MKDMNSQWKINVIKTNRRTISLQIDENLNIIVRAPLRMKDWEIQKLLQEKSGWIEKHMCKQLERQKELEQGTEKVLTAEEIRTLADDAKRYLPERVRLYADQMNVQYGRITIRNQRTRWGSCSVKGNLNFNCLLMLMPPEVIDYVVVHELCHRKEMNHSPKFWQEVEKVLPDYKTPKKWLKENGDWIMRRMTQNM